MTEVTGSSIIDAAGNLGHYWAKLGVKATGIYTIGDVSVLGTYTTYTTGADLYANYAWDATVVKSVNGASTSSFSTTNITRGSTTKFFTDVLGATVNLIDSDSDGDVDRVNITQAYLAKVNTVVAETATNDRYVTATAYTGYGTTYFTGSATTASFKFYTKNFAKGDYILVVPSANVFAASSSYTTVVSAVAAKSVTATVSATNAVYATATADGTTYSFDANFALGRTNAYPQANVGIASKYDFYLDASGLIIGSVLNTSAITTLDFAYIKGSAIVATSALSGITVTSAQAKIVKLDGSVSIVNLDVKTATVALATSSTATYNSGDATNTTINVGDKYVIVKDSSGTTKYYEIFASSNTTLTGALTDNLVSFVVNADGSYTFSKLLTSAATYPVTAYLRNVAGTSTVAADKVTFVKGSPEVAFARDAVAGDASYGTATTLYATTATKLVTVDAAGKVSTITGYANFASKVYSVGSDSVTQIVYVANNQGILSNVLVIGAAPASSIAPDAYAFYLSPGNLTAEGQYYNFLVGGVVKSYLNVSSTTLGSGDVGKAYGLYLDSTGAIATMDFSHTVAGVVTLHDGFVTVTYSGGTALIYTSSLVAVNVIDVANGNAFADVIEDGDTVEFVFTTSNSVNTAAAAFIVG